MLLHRKCGRLLGAAALLSGTLMLHAAGPVDFATQVQPILRAHCYACHQGEKAPASLRLDSKATALAGGALGPVILPGNSKDSRILQRLLATDPKVRMPFGGAPLAPETIELIRAWIDQGAPWPEEQPAAKH